MSFAYASIKSKIRKFQVVLECRKRIAECLLSCDLLTSAAVVVSYCMIFPVGSDNAKEGYRLRTSIGWPAPRGTGVFFCFLTSLNTDFFLPFLIQSRKSKKRAWEIDLKIPMKDPGERHANDHARDWRRRTGKALQMRYIFLAWKLKCWQARHVKRDLRVCLNNRYFLACVAGGERGFPPPLPPLFAPATQAKIFLLFFLTRSLCVA